MAKHYYVDDTIKVINSITLDAEADCVVGLRLDNKQFVPVISGTIEVSTVHNCSPISEWEDEVWIAYLSNNKLILINEWEFK